MLYNEGDFFSCVCLYIFMDSISRRALGLGGKAEKDGLDIILEQVAILLFRIYELLRPQIENRAAGNACQLLGHVLVKLSVCFPGGLREPVNVLEALLQFVQRRLPRPDGAKAKSM